MSLELSGTTGVKGVAGSVSAPSIVGDDTNTGISFPSADTIKFSTGGVERMAITNSGVTGVGGGKILQVQQTVGTGVYSTNSQTYSDVITCAITPAATTSKIICIYKIGLSTSNGGYSGAVRLARDSTAIYVGAGSGSRIQASSHFVADSDGIGHVKISDQAGTFMDEPSTTSAITYRLQYRTDYSGQYLYAGMSVQDTDATYRGRVPTSLLLMEVGA